MEFKTRKEVAEFFRVNPRTVERWLKSGKLKGYKLGEGKTAPWRPHCRHGHCLCPCHPQARAFFPLCPLLLRRGGG